MKKREIHWDRDLAYAIGLIATDGCLSNDGRHIDLTSKDIEQIINFKNSLKLTNKIGIKYRSADHSNSYFHVQFGDVILYEFLLEIGLTPNKSKTIGELKIPQEFFFDFLRGCIDGDGNVNIAKHPESSKLQLRLRLSSASLVFLRWIEKEVRRSLDIQNGTWVDFNQKREFILVFGKSISIRLIELIYHDEVKYFLTRKRNLLEQFRASGEMVNAIDLGSIAARLGGSTPLSPTKE